MTRDEAINWIINLTADIGKVEHRDLWHYEQALEEIRDMIEAMPLEQPESEEMSGKGWVEWCTDCKEYDHERHCCPRFRDVIFRTVAELTDNAYVEGYTAAEAKYREGLQDAE